MRKHREWVFTFGADHVDPETGESLRNTFVRIPGTFDEARATMVLRFGWKWAFQYSSETHAGVAKYGLRELR